MNNSKYRLDIHIQIKGYYSIFFSGKHELRPNHTSLYMFLLNQNNRAMWVEWFKCPYDLAMMGSGIGSKKTYYRVLKDLQDFKLIKYQAGINLHKAPKINIINLSTRDKSEQLSVPLSEPVDTPQHTPLGTPLSEQLGTPIIRLLTNNIILVTNNLEKWIKSEQKPKLLAPTIEDRKQVFSLHTSEINFKDNILNDFTLNDEAKGFIPYWTEHGMNDKKMKFEKQKSFDVKRRLHTWKNNAKDFGNKNKNDTNGQFNQNTIDLTNW